MSAYSEASPALGVNQKWPQWLAVISLIYVILLAVGMIGSGFKAATGNHAKELFEFAANPFMGLIIGTICTALIQSSSTVTSIIVGMVSGGLPVATAIPMVMGANIGTTITNTLVSLGHVRDKNEFKRAFSAATVHDFFNVISVLIFLPLEIMFGFLEKASAVIANFFLGGNAMSMSGLNFIKPITKPVISAISDLLSTLGLSQTMAGAVTIILGIGLIFFAITLIGKLLKTLMVGKAKQVLHAAIGRGPLSGIGSGTLVTVLVQSSSTTTSLMVPLVGSGVFKVRDIYPFTLGANIGTCITALLAATAISGGNAVFALQIAIVHLVYNILGVVVIYGIPFLREIPLILSEKLAGAAAERKLYAVGYVLGVFFITPGLLIMVSR
ncbi:Na/Pi symporter [Photobacterium sp. MCCC 1A19761]|uniref:Na/Pi symporter n=1 Tax=Photobacterium sp. MCCC 1A19761 TaxID=3115000 RepID=UPI00307ECFBD